MRQTCRALIGRQEITGGPPAALESADGRGLPNLQTFSNQVAFFRLRPGARLVPHTGPVWEGIPSGTLGTQSRSQLARLGSFAHVALSRATTIAISLLCLPPSGRMRYRGIQMQHSAFPTTRRPTNYRIYCHLGLIVPKGPWLRVGQEPPREWESGRRETSEEWLRSQSGDVQRQILGPTRLEEFRNGNPRVLGAHGVPRPVWRVQGRSAPPLRRPSPDQRPARVRVQRDRATGQVQPFPEI